MPSNFDASTAAVSSKVFGKMPVCWIGAEIPRGNPSSIHRGNTSCSGSAAAFSTALHSIEGQPSLWHSTPYCLQSSCLKSCTSVSFRPPPMSLYKCSSISSVIHASSTPLSCNPTPRSCIDLLTALFANLSPPMASRFSLSLHSAVVSSMGVTFSLSDFRHAARTKVLFHLPTLTNVLYDSQPWPSADFNHLIKAYDHAIASPHGYSAARLVLHTMQSSTYDHAFPTRPPFKW